MFPCAELLLYTLSMVAWIEKHPSRKLLVSLIVAWTVGKIAEMTVYSRPWHIHYEWFAILLVIVVWAKLQRAKGYLALFLATLTQAGQYLFILNEPGIVPHQELLFPLMLIAITQLAAHSFWDLANALCGALLLNQLVVVFFFHGIVYYQELPDPHYWQLAMVYLCVAATVQRHKLWPVNSSSSKVSMKG